MKNIIESKYCCRIEGIMVYVDSSTFELRNILKHQTGKRVRGLLTPEQLFVWPSFDMTHAEMLKELYSSGEIEEGIKPIFIKIMLHDIHLDFFAYGKDLDKLLKNPIIIKLIKYDPEHNHILEM